MTESTTPIDQKADGFRGHIAIDEGVALARNAGASTLVVTHMFEENDPAATVELARTMFDGEVVHARPGTVVTWSVSDLIDQPGLRVGHWTDQRARTGCTVLAFDAPALSAVEVRGAAPGSRELECLAPGRLEQHANAIVLTGGSAFGLAAADGVVRELAGRGIRIPDGGRAGSDRSGCR